MQEISGRRNYNGFNYKDYLKTKSIYGIVKSNNIKLLTKNNVNRIYKYSINIRDKIREKIKLNFTKEHASVLIALLIGDKSELEEDIANSFKTSGLSHVLAISGLHVSYIIIFINYLLSKLKISKKISSIFIIVFLIIYMIITSFAPSIVRASIMGIIILASNIFYRKPDFWTSISISFLTITIFNPFSILSTGLILSYVATISIVIFSKKISKSKNKIKQIAITSVSAQILLMPISINLFSVISIYFIIANVLITPILAIIITLGFILVITFFISNNICNPISYILDYILKAFILIPKYISNLPFAKIYISKLNSVNFILYYLIIFVLVFLKSCKLKQQNKVNLRRYEKNFLKNKTYKKILILFLVILISTNFIFKIYEVTDKTLKIYFIDVSQGDSTLIITPNKQSILIDGGDFNKDILLPYLLSRNIKKLDYIIISHFDSDHVRPGCLV